MRTPLSSCPTGQTNKRTHRPHSVSAAWAELDKYPTKTCHTMRTTLNRPNELLLGYITLVLYYPNSLLVFYSLCFYVFFLPHLHTCTYIAIFFQYTQNTWGLSQDMLGRIGAVTIDAVANIFCVDVFIFIFLVFLLFVFPFVAHLSGDLLCLAFIFEIWISIFFSFFPIFARQTEMFAFCGAFQAIRLWVLFSWPFWEGVVSHLWAW